MKKNHPAFSKKNLFNLYNKYQFNQIIFNYNQIIINQISIYLIININLLSIKNLLHILHNVLKNSNLGWEKLSNLMEDKTSE